MLLRNAVGETLRDARTRQNRTLRDVSTAAPTPLIPRRARVAADRPWR